MEDDKEPNVLVITNQTLVPPDGWRYVQKESGYKMKSLSLKTLKEKIFKHRSGNGYDVAEGWWIEVQLELCLDMDIVDSHCGFVDPNEAKPKDHRLRIVDVLQFFRSVREWKVNHGLEYIDIEIAEQRSAICAACPKNVKIPGCVGCEGILQWFLEYKVDKHATKLDEFLDYCQVCKCALKLKIHLPEEVIKKVAHPDQEFPSHCWALDI